MKFGKSKNYYNVRFVMVKNGKYLEKMSKPLKNMLIKVFTVYGN